MSGLQLETLEAAYRQWAALRQTHREALASVDLKLRQLEAQGALLVGAVRVATGTAAEVLEPGDALSKSSFASEATAKLEAAKRRLVAERDGLERAFEGSVQERITTIVARARAQATVAPPKLELVVRELGPDRRILHLRRLSDDAAITAMVALEQRIPSRYGFLGDDSMDELSLPAPSLYAESALDLRPTARQLVAFLESQPVVWPVKGALPMRVSDGRWMRWVTRGVMIEAELADDETFRNVLTQREAELIAGRLVAAKLSGAIDLELVTD